jgi:DNA-binding XRE family transcriptional regulator
MKLTASLYRLARKARGTQTAVAEALGIRRVTIMRRETARSTVTLEAMLALLTLPVIRDSKCQKKNRKSASLTDAASATAPAPPRSRGAGNGSVAGATTLSRTRSTSVAQLRITRGKGEAITYIASAD